MILELVLFKSPPGMDRAAVLEDAKHTIPRWRANADLLRKHYILGDDGTGGGVYLWPSKEAAQNGHDAAWREGVRKRTGAEPVIRYFDLLMVVDNENGSVTEWTERGEARPVR
jgi:hypothetical protein